MTAARPRQVVLLTQDDCAFCDSAKEVLRRVAADDAELARMHAHLRQADTRTRL